MLNFSVHMLNFSANLSSNISQSHLSNSFLIFQQYSPPPIPGFEPPTFWLQTNLSTCWANEADNSYCKIPGNLNPCSSRNIFIFINIRTIIITTKIIYVVSEEFLDRPKTSEKIRFPQPGFEPETFQFLTYFSTQWANQSKTDSPWLQVFFTLPLNV